jgi:hypothetical protein
VRLTFNDAFNRICRRTRRWATTPELSFDIPAQGIPQFLWRLHVPDGMGFLTYKVVAASGNLSDGEEGHLPVLSAPCPGDRVDAVADSGSRPRAQFRFEKLLESDQFTRCSIRV